MLGPDPQNRDIQSWFLEGSWSSWEGGGGVSVGSHYVISRTWITMSAEIRDNDTEALD